MTLSRTLLASLGLAACLTLPACQSNVPADYYTGTTLDRNPIGVAEDSAYIEVALDPRTRTVNPAEYDRIRNFAADYRQRGHGPLIVAIPGSYGADPYTVSAVAEARDIAWGAGIDYASVVSRPYDAGGRTDAPMLLTFRAYTAIAPYCPQKSQVNFSDITGNSDMTTLGCSVRVNQAAMIADPYDLLGQRALEDGDIVRRMNQLELFRNGESTGAERSEQESSAVSNAVN